MFQDNKHEPKIFNESVREKQSDERRQRDSEVKLIANPKMYKKIFLNQLCDVFFLFKWDITKRDSSRFKTYQSDRKALIENSEVVSTYTP